MWAAQQGHLSLLSLKTGSELGWFLCKALCLTRNSVSSGQLLPQHERQSPSQHCLLWLRVQLEPPLSPDRDPPILSISSAKRDFKCPFFHLPSPLGLASLHGNHTQIPLRISSVQLLGSQRCKIAPGESHASIRSPLHIGEMFEVLSGTIYPVMI